MAFGAALKGRAAIVTGGASGLGRAIAMRFAQEGADVCIMSLSRERVQLLPNELKYFAAQSEIADTHRAILECGVRCVALDGDVSKVEDVERMVEQTREQFGRVDILVNNAATDVVHPVLNHNDASWKRVIDVNLLGPYYCTRAALPHMVENHWGRVISIASTSAHVGSAGYSAYSASKHGLLGFSRCLAIEVAPYNITSNTISPAFIETPSAPLHIGRAAEESNVSFDEMRQKFINDYPQKRFVKPEEIADLVAYLCREEAQAINGEDIRITTGAMW
jgi:NAD(P)-dependent dehydrogenase (short-subunit alcohol dehydrogenase family)